MYEKYPYIYITIKINVMKTTNYNKSEILKRAWEMFNSTSNYDSIEDCKYDTFATCLKDSWTMAKNTTSELMNDNYSIKEIFTILENRDFNFTSILEIVANNSKGFQSDIAKKALKYNSMTTKQAWCVAYEFKNVA